MRIEGLIKSWNDERGFGFIEPTQGGQEIFVHIKAFQPRIGRPKIGQYVAFEIEQNREGKKRAKNVELIRAARLASRARSNSPAYFGAVTLFAIPAFAVVYVIVGFLWNVPHIVAGAYAAASVVCFAVYAVDKASASSGGWRISESTLLAIGLFGGWPGGLVAQQFLRHKSVKRSFRLAFWVTVIANIFGFVVLSSPKYNAWARLTV